MFVLIKGDCSQKLILNNFATFSRSVDFFLNSEGSEQSLKKNHGSSKPNNYFSSLKKGTLVLFTIHSYF